MGAGRRTRVDALNGHNQAIDVVGAKLPGADCSESMFWQCSFVEAKDTTGAVFS